MSLFHLKPLRQQTDEQLMTRAAAGSDAAFEELYRRYARRLKGFFFMQLGGDEELAMPHTTYSSGLTKQEAAMKKATSLTHGSSPSPTTFAATTIAAMPTKRSYWPPLMQSL